ncbi:MAG: hypothetical protein OEW00_14855 [candidate division Zixibacteria bacterium]|nr:hypothetical protein [candidate division Zixibacteria bacterium]
MSAKLKSVFLRLACATACLLLLASAAISGPLVFRDDFICYDTLTSFCFDYCGGIDVCLDSAGFFSQINTTTVPSSGARAYQYNRFDASGNRVGPVTVFMPDTVSQDTIWQQNVRLNCFGNDFGTTAVVGTVANRGADPIHPPSNIVAFLFDRLGTSQGHPVCFDCDDPYGYPNYAYYGSGAINNAGVVGAVWYVEIDPPYEDSLYARLYYPDQDSLGPCISLFQFPAPFDPTNLIVWPRIGVADDNSFAVTWISDHSARLYYVVINSDGTPRCDVQLVYPDIEGVRPGYRAPFHVDLAMEADGDFYIAWYAKYSGIGSPCLAQVLMRGFNADGTPKYDPMRIVDTDSTRLPYTYGWGPYPSIDCDDSGNVLVAWSDGRDFPGYPDPFDPRNVYAQKIDPQGRLVGPNYRINNNLGNACYLGENSMCDINNAGQAVILWYNETGPYQVSAQLIPYHDIGTFVPGDLNLDFKGNISDLVYLLTYLYSGKADSMRFWPKSLPDLNGDGKNGNITDVCYMVDYLFGTPTGPVPHTPDAGIREPLPIWPGPIGSPLKGVTPDEE